MIYIAVAGDAKYSVGTLYGPFKNKEEAIRWLDNNPSLRDGFRWLFVGTWPIEVE